MVCRCARARHWEDRPGRADILKFRDLAIARKPSVKSIPAHALVPNRANAAVSIAIVPKAAPAKPAVSTPVASILSHSVPVHVTAPPAPLAPPARPPHRGTIGYADVMSEKQKAILQVRAEALEITPTDFDRLLTSDEKAHFQALIEERQHLVNEQ